MMYEVQIISVTEYFCIEKAVSAKLSAISSENIAVLSLSCTLCELQMNCIFKVFCGFIKVLLEEQVWAWVLVTDSI